MFAGLMSRWMMPSSCAWARPDRTWRDDVGRAREVELAGLLDAILRLVPRTNSITRYGLSSWTPKSITETQLRVLEHRHQLGFALEALAARELVGERLVHDLDRDGAAELQALAAIDAAHRALGDRLDDLVATVEDGTAEVMVWYTPEQ